jgi:uncharacterized protein (TIGR04255 family)
MPDLESDPFPYAPRVHYKNAPLFNVVCQLRFPPILRLEGQAPADFQEAIRGTFPLLERMQPPILSQIPPEILQGIQMQGGWTFLTEDRSISVGLSVDSISLTVAKYERWERFTELLYGPLVALERIYKPAFFTRIGLRYQDLILRSALGLDGVPWSMLFRSEIMGELSVPAIEENLEDARRVLRLKLPAIGASVLLQHGMGFRPDRGPEQGYMIDLDFYTTSKVEVSDAKQSIDNLHGGVGRAFRWCISDRLHAALDPVPL